MGRFGSSPPDCPVSSDSCYISSCCSCTLVIVSAATPCTVIQLSLYHHSCLFLLTSQISWCHEQYVCNDPLQSHIQKTSDFLHAFVNFKKIFLTNRCNHSSMDVSQTFVLHAVYRIISVVQVYQYSEKICIRSVTVLCCGFAVPPLRIALQVLTSHPERDPDR